MSLEPQFKIRPHLFHMVREVALLNLDPKFERDSAVARMFDGVRPDGVGHGDQKLMRHTAKTVNDFKGLARALVKISERPSPTRGIDPEDRAAGLSDEAATTDVGISLAVGKMENDLVNAPPIR